MKRSILFIICISLIGCNNRKFYYKEIDYTEVAILVKKGTNKPINEELYTGGRFKIDQNYELIVYDVMQQSKSLIFPCLSKDDVEFDIQMNVRFSILRDSVVNLHKEFGPKYFEYLISPEVRHITRSFVSQVDLADFSLVVDSVKSRIGDKLLSEGILVSSVNIDKGDSTENIP